MSCLLTSNITKDCKYNVSGVKKLYLFNYDIANTYSADTEGVITAITLANEGKYYEMEFEDDSASYSDNLTVSNNNRYRTQTVNFEINGAIKGTVPQVDALSLGKFGAVVVDKNSNVVLLGANNGLSATSANYASGAASGDKQGWTCVLTGIEPETLKVCKDITIIDANIYKGKA